MFNRDARSKAAHTQSRQLQETVNQLRAILKRREKESVEQIATIRQQQEELERLRLSLEEKESESRRQGYRIAELEGLVETQELVLERDRTRIQAEIAAYEKRIQQPPDPELD